MQNINMNIINIIEKKKNKEELSQEEIKYFVINYTNNEIPDYQISSLLMAIRLNGLSLDETIYLTQAMVQSGQVINYNINDRIIVDKHSTGGVGDKTSLVLIPLLASLGFGVSKMSGRGLGFTGGTIDKLESIEGFNVELTKEQIINQVKTIGCVIVGQSSDIVPADKKLYALRDVTATVDSLGLIASSIMSKKIALGAQNILLDVKYGDGGFMKTIQEARELANLMRAIGQGLGKEVVCFITSMDQPLGKNIGNALEVQEAVDTLKGQGDMELRELCIQIAKEALLINKNINNIDAQKLVEEKINSRKALEKFYEMIKSQGAKSRDFKLEKASKTYEFCSSKSGYISKIKAMDVGLGAMNLGAGRKTKEDHIDQSVGFELVKKIGDKVQKGQTLVIVHYNNDQKLKDSLSLLKEAYEVVDQKVSKPELIEEIIK